jgi:hypothetical protein
MSCYLRHMQRLLDQAGIAVTKENRQDVDRLIHELVAVGYKNCPVTWKEVKRWIAEDEAGFVARLKEQWAQREG